MPKRVTLIELNVFQRMLPLVSGYLQSYACTDPEIRRDYEFRRYTNVASADHDTILADLVAQDADIYAFSSYLWNIRLVQQLLGRLRELKPRSRFLLGGPQVMHHGRDYLPPGDERVAVCDGEGEKTFAAYLGAMTDPHPDLSTVKGLSFYRDGELVTTEPEVRLRSLDEVPSPFTGGLFDDRYEMTVLETNRGCPFRCGFCFWGAATNDKVVRFSEDRVRDDIEWIARNQVPFIFLADANWGMHKRDIEYSRHIVRCKEEHGLPIYVYFSAAKNSPGRVTSITDVFKHAGLLNAQPISLQTMSETSLAKIDRSNIKLDAYEELQRQLNASGTSSFIELIWPLPGETLTSFKSGIDTLCEKGAAHLITYPHLLLHNTPLYGERDTHGLVTRVVNDGASEAELVIGTADVSTEDFEEGLWFFYAVLALYNAKALPDVTGYLRREHGITHQQLYSDFVRHARAHPGFPFSAYCNRSIATADFYDVHNYAMVHHEAAHEKREGFDRLLHGFATAQPWWDDTTARGLFELDLLSRPYFYSNTPVAPPPVPLDVLSVVDAEKRAYTVAIPSRIIAASRREIAGRGATGAGADRVRIDHHREQHPLRPEQDRQRTANYCNGIVMRIHGVQPTLSTTEAAGVAGALP